MTLATMQEILRSCALALVTPLLEKSPTKALGASIHGVEVPLAFSMTRAIVLAFAVGVLHQIWRAGVHGWPEATLAIAIVLALPVVGALDRVPPSEAVALAKTLLGRFGVGEAVRPEPLDPVLLEPSKYDDHREEAGIGLRVTGDGAADAEAA